MDDFQVETLETLSCYYSRNYENDHVIFSIWESHRFVYSHHLQSKYYNSDGPVSLFVLVSRTHISRGNQIITRPYQKEIQTSDLKRPNLSNVAPIFCTRILQPLLDPIQP